MSLSRGRARRPARAHGGRARPPLRRERGKPLEPARQVPVPLSEDLHRRGQERRSHDRRVDEDGDREPEPHLLDVDLADGREEREDRHRITNMKSGSHDAIAKLLVKPRIPFAHVCWKTRRRRLEAALVQELQRARGLARRLLGIGQRLHARGGAEHDGDDRDGEPAERRGLPVRRTPTACPAGEVRVPAHPPATVAAVSRVPADPAATRVSRPSGGAEGSRPAERAAGSPAPRAAGRSRSRARRGRRGGRRAHAGR
jgi:hypothetical protein